MAGRGLAHAARRPGRPAHPVVVGAGRRGRSRAGQRGVLGRAAAPRRGLLVRRNATSAGRAWRCRSALLLVLGLTRLGARLTRRLPGPWWVRALLATLAVLVLGELATAPFDLAMRSNALDYGLTRQSLGGWLRDQGTSLLVSWVFAGVMVLLVLGTARRSPRRWPLWAGLAGALLTVLGSWVYPLAVEPLFNEFTPLPHGELRTEHHRAGGEGARPGLRGAGGRRVPAYDDPERLRLRHRQHQAGGALRQPGRGRARA